MVDEAAVYTPTKLWERKKTSIGYDSVGFTGTIVSYSDVSVIANVQRLDYTYDELGNVVTREDSSLENGPVIDNYTYDAMNRLSSQTTTSDVIGNYAKFKAYRYDKIGNIVYQTGIGEYAYHTTAPHAVKTAGNRNYTYDAAGNMINRNGDTITYNPLNKPAVMENHTNGKEVRFYYGIGDARYMKLTSGAATYYIGKGYEEQVEDYEEKQIAYITVGNKVVGTHTEVKNLYYAPTHENYNEATYNRYFHTDALGSITAITDDTGTVVERRSYDAFGKIRAMDYGTNNNTFANRVIETTRAYTGHEQIAELSGLVHMNARVYDSDIGRFLSADTIIQAPHDSQSYNRYSYVRNNPLMYTDPSGHSWFSKLWKKIKKHIKTIVAIAIAAVIAIYAPGLLVQYGGAVFGSTVAGVTTLSAVGVMTVGAMAGFASGAIMTGSLEGALQGALWGAVSAGVAFGVGETLGHAGGIFTKGVKSGQAFIKAAAHGLSRGIISMAQGGTFKSGFASGFSASFFSPGTTMGGDGAGGFGLRTSIAAIVGGTASALGGGKFSNGAISGAFVHMFNAEGGTLQKIGNQAKELWDKFTDYISAGVTVGGGIHTGLVGVNGQYNPLSDSLTVCVRVGPGLFAGAGVSATGSIDSNPNSNGSQYSAGVGGDYMNGIYGNGGSVSVSSDTVSGSYATRAGIGVGLSLGVDLCGTF